MKIVHTIIHNIKLNRIRILCFYYGITSYRINNNYSIDVDGDVNVGNKSVKKLLLNFKDVSGNFTCSNCGLTTLKGSPKYVGGFFNCDNNNLTSLLYCPDYVGDYFSFDFNDIRSFESFPYNFGGHIFYFNGFQTNSFIEMVIQNFENHQIKTFVRYYKLYDVVDENTGAIIMNNFDILKEEIDNGLK